MMDRLKALKTLDRKRLDATLMRIHGRPALMVFFNGILLGINSLGRGKQMLKFGLGKLGLIKTDSLVSSANLKAAPGAFSQRLMNAELSVLIICETSIPQCFRYRVVQKLQQLGHQGRRCRWVDWTNYMEVSNQIAFHDVIVFYRVPGYPKMMANIEYASRLGKVVFYDTDDLIFDREVLESYYSQTTGQLSKKELKGVFRGAGLYLKAVQACRFAMTTTPVLKQKLETVLGENAVYLLPNGLDTHSQEAVVKARPPTRLGVTTLFYGSGTKTHDQDFALIAAPLSRLMDKHAELELVIVGYLTLPARLEALTSRITRIGLLEVDEYLRVLSCADINLAPLTPGVFADCKSEIKWLEAAALGVPTVASATRVYRKAITHEHDGLVAESDAQWFQALDALVANPDLRTAMGQAAQRSAQEKYAPQVQAGNFIQVLDDAARIHAKEKGFGARPQNIRHIVMVNVLYPPQAMGGATVVAQNMVNTLSRQFGQDFHVTVFTCDINNIYAYQVNEYECQGVSVTAVSVPVGPDVDYRAYDAHVGELFGEYLDYQQPDLVHFHSIQRLTASMLDAALNREVPFVVTVHDAWWVSDHQFLVDESGAPVLQPQANPIVAARTSTDVQQTVQRTAQLTSLLNQASKVLAVSDYQAGFYRQNGIENIQVNANGVNPLTGTERDSESGADVVLGYCGSICHHKGYYFLRQVIESQEFSNLKLKVVQFDLTQPRKQTWNGVEVEFVPKLDATHMGSFYAGIDVLIAPSMWPESFGLITREAALAGVWLVAADAGGLAEVIEPDKNGFAYPMGSADKLADILTRIDTNPGRYKQRVAREYIAALKINTVDQQVKELVNVYNSVLD